MISDAYYESSNAFVDKVLESRKGIPVSLGSILLYLGRKRFTCIWCDFPKPILNQVRVVW